MCNLGQVSRGEVNHSVNLWEAGRAQQHSVSQWEWCTAVCGLGSVAEGVAQTVMVPSPAFSLHPAPVTSCGILHHKFAGGEEV